jgi:hypothetical protein
LAQSAATITMFHLWNREPRCDLSSRNPGA